MMTHTAAVELGTLAGPVLMPTRWERVRSQDRQVNVTCTADDPLSVLPVAIRGELAEIGVSRPCEEMFAWLAQRHPEQLLDLIEKGNLAPADLTYAAEIAGRVPGSEGVLLPLLSSGHRVVREGAIYGLAESASDRVRERLQRLAESDPSRAVRDAAAEVLNG